MAGVFDLHTIMVLQDQWSTRFGSSLSSFSEPFQGMVSDAILSEYYTELSSKPISFRPAYVSEKPGIPQVVVHLNDEPVEEQFLSYFAGNTGTGSNIKATQSLLLKEQVTCTIFTDYPEITRALYVIVRASMIAAHPFWLRAGYASLSYDGGGDLMLDDQMIPEEMGYYTRVQRWSAMSETQITTTETFEHKNVMVLAIDSKDSSGNSGGVDPGGN